MTEGDRIDRLAERIAELSAQFGMYIAIVNDLKEIINGTAKTGGLKERLAITEEDVKRNKDSFKKIDDNITVLRNEMLIEIGKLTKKSGINWGSVLQAVVTALAIGVTGIVFWQLIRLLAANAP